MPGSCKHSNKMTNQVAIRYSRALLHGIGWLVS